MEFPKAVRVAVGYALSEAQHDRRADYVKPMKGLGSGVIEILVDCDSDAYRAVYAVKIGDSVYVLHAFKKKSKSGVSTPKPEIDLVRNRLRLVKSRVKHG